MKGIDSVLEHNDIAIVKKLKENKDVEKLENEKTVEQEKEEVKKINEIHSYF